MIGKSGSGKSTLLNLIGSLDSVTSGTINIDGNNNTITQADTVLTSNHALLYIDGNSNVAISNIVFDGINGSAIRTVNANIMIDNCVFENGTHTGNQGIVRLNMGSAVVKNTKFLNNNGTMMLSFNYDAANETDTLLVENCEFIGNTSNDIATLYYVSGASCTIKNSKFENNITNTTGNGATIYLGFQENCVVTGNEFKENEVVSSGTSTRVGGALFIGYEAEISENAFINNKASNSNGDKLGQDVCISLYYTNIDLGQNYWG